MFLKEHVQNAKINLTNSLGKRTIKAARHQHNFKKKENKEWYSIIEMFTFFMKFWFWNYLPGNEFQQLKIMNSILISNGKEEDGIQGHQKHHDENPPTQADN